MIRIIHFSIALIITITILVIFFASSCFPLLSPSSKLILPIVYGCVASFMFFAWGGDIMGDIRKAIEDQLNNFHNVENAKKNKEHFKKALEDYKTEFEDKLLTDYKKFEETIMSNIKDSKLIAAALQENSFSKVLQSYHSTVNGMMVNISKCDTDIESYIKKMKIREDQKIFGYGSFLPAEFTHDKLKND